MILNFLGKLNRINLTNSSVCYEKHNKKYDNPTSFALEVCGIIFQDI